MKVFTLRPICKIIAALILIQSSFLKFSAAPESVSIFSMLGMEPVGRIAIGWVEAIACVFLFIPRANWVGALLGFALTGGAILAHLTDLGIEVNNSPKFFIASVLVFICCSVILWYERKIIPMIGKLFV